MIGLGTIVNAVGVVLGGFVGLLFRKGLKERFQETIMQSIGLAVIFIGAAGAMQGLLVITESGLTTAKGMLTVFAMVLGGITGELLNIEGGLEKFGSFLRKKFSKGEDTGFLDGFINASLTICIGAMAIVGSLEDGMTGDATMLFTKTILDTVILVVFASTYGIGALFSVIPLVLLQGGVTVLARFIAPLMTDAVIANLSFLGSMLIFCVGSNLMFKTKIKVCNLLPSLIYVAVLGLFI